MMKIRRYNSKNITVLVQQQHNAYEDLLQLFKARIEEKQFDNVTNLRI